MVRVYSMFDRKLRQYGQLMLERNHYAIQRTMVDGLQASPDSLIAKHPEDFDLVCFGEFNEESGVMSVGAPELVINLGELVAGGMKEPALARERPDGTGSRKE